MDIYADGRIKGNTQTPRGNPGITGSNKLTPPGKDWKRSLANGESKTELIHILSAHSF